jgi:hypothetical protein
MTRTTRSTWTRRIAAVILAAIFSLAIAACSSSGKGSDAQAGKSAAASVTANPQFIKAKALVKHCFAGTPVQQAQQVHLVFLSSKTGKHGPAVVAARAKVLGCMGISKADEQPFINEAVTASRYGKVLLTHNGRVTYFGTDLPKIVLKYSNAASVSPSAGTTPNSPGATTAPASATPAPATSTAGAGA